jgi:hypothetical protein
MINEIFLLIYTNAVKSYCDKIFFNFVNRTGLEGIVIDNSDQDFYSVKLSQLSRVPVMRIEPSKANNTGLKFLENVLNSLKVGREMFLKSGCKYLLIMESDVIPPDPYFYERLIFRMERLDNAGIVGAKYYNGFHKFELKEHQTHHCLSGCTLYKRELIAEYPFKIDYEKNPNAFPDAWICDDINHTETGTHWKFYDINMDCKHLENGQHRRGHELL